MIHSVLLLDDDLVMVQFRNSDRGFGLQVLNEEGQLVTEFIGIPSLFDHAHGGLAYRVIQPEMDESGDYSNPFLSVY
ncbi:MAG: hypothetical protein OXU68_12405 [Bacteroidota bacterium]|nr:hypothetical protein [Bacteroidota bacterium]